MPVPVAKRHLRALIGSKWTDEKFEEYWSLVYFRIFSGPDPSSPTVEPLVSTTVDATGRHRLLISSSPPILSFTCHLRLTLRHQAQQHWLTLLTLAILLASTAAYHLHSKSQRRDAQVVNTLIEDVLECLYSESENHRVDPQRHPVPGLSVAMVRDHFLTISTAKSAAVLDAYGYAATLDAQDRTRWTVSDVYTRDKVWTRVRKGVLGNANVRETGMVVGGEEDVVWVWVGSFALSPKKRNIVPARSGAGSGGGSGGSGRGLPGRISLDGKGVARVVKEVEEEVVGQQKVKVESEESLRVVREGAGGNVDGASSPRNVAYPTL
ncbi:hypothetical protein HDU99_002009 [Rhizoclosmatium hyalinum]|nr:hypothetical protein HDU99_002009 [Rhizoclosmatium hyalinum]